MIYSRHNAIMQIIREQKTKTKRMSAQAIQFDVIRISDHVNFRNRRKSPFSSMQQERVKRMKVNIQVYAHVHCSDDQHTARFLENKTN